MEYSEKLMSVQSRLKAPKGQFNKFGGYNYRSCEDILEAVKPLLAEVRAVITIGDEAVLVGEWHYIRSTAVFLDVETGKTVQNTALAREEMTKKGMDASQITGTASSYARKYALNGLLCIDDTKDSDTDEHRNESDARAASGRQKRTEGKKGNVGKATGDSTGGPSGTITQGQYRELTDLMAGAGLTEDKVASAYRIKSLTELPAEKFDSVVRRVNMTMAEKRKETDRNEQG